MSAERPAPTSTTLEDALAIIADRRDVSYRTGDHDSGKRWEHVLDALESAMLRGQAELEAMTADRDRLAAEVERLNEMRGDDAESIERLEAERDDARRAAESWRNESGWSDLLPWEPGYEKHANIKAAIKASEAAARGGASDS